LPEWLSCAVLAAQLASKLKASCEGDADYRELCGSLAHDDS
jgi:hypothetical protein